MIILQKEQKKKKIVLSYIYSIFEEAQVLFFVSDIFSVY